MKDNIEVEISEAKKKKNDLNICFLIECNKSEE